jgi:hypothetical protein
MPGSSMYCKKVPAMRDARLPAGAACHVRQLFQQQYLHAGRVQGLEAARGVGPPYNGNGGRGPWKQPDHRDLR